MAYYCTACNVELGKDNWRQSSRNKNTYRCNVCRYELDRFGKEYFYSKYPSARPRKKPSVWTHCQYCNDVLNDDTQTPSLRKTSYCTQCNNKKAKQWYHDNKEHVKKRSLRYKYNITEQQLEELLDTERACDICGKQGKLFVDHNHSTEEVRGFLCPACNTGLGMFMDNIPHLARAIEYLFERGSYGAQ